MLYQAVYDSIWRCILSNIATGTHTAICNSMQHQIWKVCVVTRHICINFLQRKGLSWCSIIKSVFKTLHVKIRVYTYLQSFES